MNRIVDVFGQPAVLLPVVHPIHRQAALDAVRAAHTLGIKGVFLINQPMSDGELFPLAREVRQQFPTLWLGLNLLGQSPISALSGALNACGTIDGLWTDNAGIEARRVRSEADSFVAARAAKRWHGLYFGGVAFKYQREIADGDLEAVARTAAPYVDVLCTSGPGTGQAADVAKIRSLRGGLGDGAMAIASGVTADNVKQYLPYVQAFLVGTGIEKSFGVFDPVKMEALLRAME